MVFDTTGREMASCSQLSHVALFGHRQEHVQIAWLKTATNAPRPLHEMPRTQMAT
jgi:hypothetical protein